MIDTTTDCSTHECHVFVQNQQPEQGNYEQQEEEEQQNLVTDPTVRFTNPAEDRLHVQIQVPQSGDVSIYLYDLTGKRVLAHYLDNLEQGRHSGFITLPDLPQGLYTIAFTFGKSIITDHVLIMK